jgi:hypothetical protein
VKIKVTDVERIYGRSGQGVRCTLTLTAEHPVFGTLSQSTKGCLAFRNRRNVINLLTPCIYLGPSRVRHRPITLSPGLSKYLEAELEKHCAKDIPLKNDAVSTAGAQYTGVEIELEAT